MYINLTFGIHTGIMYGPKLKNNRNLSVTKKTAVTAETVTDLIAGSTCGAGTGSLW